MAFQLHTDLNWDDLVFMYDYDVTKAYADFYDADLYFSEDSVFTQDIRELSRSTSLSDTQAMEELFSIACDNAESGTAALA